MASVFPTETVTVERPFAAGHDAHGCAVTEYGSEQVRGVLAQPNGTSDLDAERPDGVKASFVFHFPKSYEASLKGCRVLYRGRRWRVVGDPQKLPAAPGPFDRSAAAEACDG